MNYTQKLFLIVFSFFIAWSCNSGRKNGQKLTNIRINQSGELFFQGLKMEYPLTFREFADVLGPASRVVELKDEVLALGDINVYNLEYYWDDLGIKLEGARWEEGSADVYHVFLRINETKAMPKSRLLGKLNFQKALLT